VRHGYEYELDWARMLPLVEFLPDICEQLQQDFARFEEFLIEIAQYLEKDL
jgi:hypothetical protein